MSEVSLQKDVQRRYPGGFLNPLEMSMKQGRTASKTCEKHDHSAMLQLSYSLLIFPFKELFSQTIGIQVSSFHVVLGVGFL